MHIAFISIESPFDNSQGGGIASYLRALIPALIRKGHRVTLISNSHSSPETTSPFEHLRVIHINLPGYHWYLSKLGSVAEPFILPLRQIEWSLKFYYTLKKLLIDDPADVVESSELGALFISFFSKTPLVIRLHGSDSIFRKYTGEKITLGSIWNSCLEKIILNRASVVTSPSVFQANEIAAKMGWHSKNIISIPNPISQIMLDKKFSTHINDRQSKKRPIILYTGRLARVKGIDSLLESISIVKSSVPNVLFVLAGQWQLSQSPKHLECNNNNVKQNIRNGVIWLGHLPWDQLAKWYCRASIFVIPSLYETFGISCLEAMAVGLPVVATSVGGLPEVVEDGVTGLLVPPGDITALAHAIVHLLQNAQLCKQMGQAGHRRVLEYFTPEDAANMTINIYKEIIFSA